MAVKKAGSDDVSTLSGMLEKIREETKGQLETLQQEMREQLKGEPSELDKAREVGAPISSDSMDKVSKREFITVKLKEFGETGPVRLKVATKGGRGRVAKVIFDSFVFQDSTTIPLPPSATFPINVIAFRRPMKIGRHVSGDGNVIDPDVRASWPPIAQLRGFDHGGDPCYHYDDPCPPAVQYIGGEMTNCKKPWIVSTIDPVKQEFRGRPKNEDS